MKYKITCLLIGLIYMSGCDPILTEKTGTNQSNDINVTEQIPNKDIPVSYTGDPILDSFFKPKLIVSIGDSLTQGVGDSKNHGGYLPYLQKQLETESNQNSVKMVNYGVKGNRSAQLLKQLNKEEVRKDIKKADSIIVTIGGNDIMKVFKQNFTNLEMEQFKSAKKDYETVLVQILDKIRMYNQSAPIYFIGLYNPFSNKDELYELDWIVSDWNKSGKKIVERYDSAYYIKIEDIFKNSKEDVLYTEDYFHPNDRGYELIATRIYRNMDLYTNGGKTIEAGVKGDEKQ